MRVVILSALVLGLAGCANARLVKETSDGGRVMAYGSQGIAKEKAIKLAHAEMEKKCPNGYEITEQGLDNTGVGVYHAGMTSQVQDKYFDFKCKDNRSTEKETAKN